MKNKIAIDIGTAYTKIYKSHADVVLLEPTLIAIKNNNYKKPIAVGFEAEKLVGKTPNGVKIISPVVGAEIKDMKGLTALLAAFKSKVLLATERVSDAVITIGCGYDREVMDRLEYALSKVGFYNVEFAESPILALIGADVPVSDDSCHGIIDLGASQTTVSVLNLSGVISGLLVEFGGNYLNKLIESQVEKEVQISLGEMQAENLKNSIASLVVGDESKTVVQGKDFYSGKPRSLNVSATQIYPAVKEYADKIVEICKIVMGKLTDDTFTALTKNGVYLTGGVSRIYGLENYLSKQIGVKVSVVDEPMLSAVIGAGKLTEDKMLLSKLSLKCD